MFTLRGLTLEDMAKLWYVIASKLVNNESSNQVMRSDLSSLASLSWIAVDLID
jgi:hypothetical protein